MKSMSVYEQAETPLTPNTMWRLALALTGTVILLVGLSALVRTLLPPESQILSSEHATWLDNATSPEMTRDMNMLAYLGSNSLVVGILCIAAGAFMWQQRWFSVTQLLASLVAALAIGAITKLIFDSHVPNLVEHISQEAAYAYPSSYGILPATLVTSLVLILWHTKWRWHALGAGVVYLLIVAIARMYLGGYYPASLILGWAIGASLALVAAHILMRSRPQKPATAHSDTAVQ